MQVDGSRRHRYLAAGHALSPLRSRALQAAPVKTPRFEVVGDNANSVANLDKANTDYFTNLAANLTPSLAAVLRPAGATRWMLPSVAAITPQYIEGVLRGALAGNHVQAWELFDLMIDTNPELAACIGEYVDAVKCKRLMVTPYCHEDQEPTREAVQKAAIVSCALRNMRPDMANDENDFGSTIKDLLFARFHGQSVLEVDWYKQDGSGLNILNFPDITDDDGQPLLDNGGRVLVPRSTFWVHPVCYAWDMYGRLGLRMALESQLQNALKQANTPKGAWPSIFNNLSVDKMRSMIEPPAWNFITSQARPGSVMDFPPNKFLIGIDKFKAGTVMGSGSVLRTLAFWWICSTYGADFALNMAQLFGIPFRKATYSASTTESQKAEIRQLLASAGAMGYALLPQGVDLEVMYGNSGGGEQSPQAFLMHFANDQIRKAILRQTMAGGLTSGSKGIGKGFGETEAEGPKDQVVCAGADYVCSVLNLQFVPYILTVNCGEGGDLNAPVCSLVDDEVGSVQDAQRDQILVQLTDVPVSYMRRKYRTPKPAPGEPIAGKDEGSLSRQQQPGAGGGFGGGDSGGSEPQLPEQEQDFTGYGGGQAAEARASLAAGAAAGNAPTPGSKKVAQAMADTFKPLVAKLAAANRLTDPDAKKAALRSLLAEIPKLTAAMKKNPSLAQAVATAIKPPSK